VLWVLPNRRPSAELRIELPITRLGVGAQARGDGGRDPDPARVSVSVLIDNSAGTEPATDVSAWLYATEGTWFFQTDGAEAAPKSSSGLSMFSSMIPAPFNAEIYKLQPHVWLTSSTMDDKEDADSTTRCDQAQMSVNQVNHGAARRFDSFFVQFERPGEFVFPGVIHSREDKTDKEFALRIVVQDEPSI
jgi:hypothetical protein